MLRNKVKPLFSAETLITNSFRFPAQPNSLLQFFSQESPKAILSWKTLQIRYSEHLKDKVAFKR